MTFASLEFSVLLIATYAVYYLLPQRGRMLFLLAMSYIFYCYWEPVYGALIFVSTLLDYGAALLIEKSASARKKRLGLLASVMGNLGMLAYFKYTGFALESLRVLLGPLGLHLPPPFDLILPAGISFYTFQTMSYTIDVYRGVKKAETDFILVALYVAFFPQLVAGPIERASTLIPQLETKQPFRFSDLEEGIRLICLGLLKKIVVADRLISAAYGNYVDPASHGSGILAFSAVAMFVAVYLDFSAYSEIARGVAALFGIRLSRNFRFPHNATNIAEYWRRWHMTMSSWVKDYLFKPLGGFKTRNTTEYLRIIMVTMGLVGLWHGANWTFVLWGLASGACLALYHLLQIHLLRRYRQSPFFNSVPWFLASWFCSTLIRVTTSVLFFSPDLKTAGIFYSRLLLNPTAEGFDRMHVQLGFAVIILFWIFHYCHERFEARGGLRAWPSAARAGVYVSLVYVILFGAMDTAEPFIYFQF